MQRKLISIIVFFSIVQCFLCEKIIVERQAGCAHPGSSLCAPAVRTTTAVHTTRAIHPPCLPGSSLCAPAVRTTTAVHTTPAIQPPCLPGSSLCAPAVRTTTAVHTTRPIHHPCPPGTTGARCEIVYFKCTKNGRFSDPFLCKNGKFLECANYGSPAVPNGVLYVRDCPPGLIYDQPGDHCGYAANVKC